LSFWQTVPLVPNTPATVVGSTVITTSSLFGAQTVPFRTVQRSVYCPGTLKPVIELFPNAGFTTTGLDPFGLETIVHCPVALDGTGVLPAKIVCPVDWQIV
jgi:hypothetical protein